MAIGWGKVWSRLYFGNQGGRFIEELRSWAVDKMFAMIQVVQPILDKTKSYPTAAWVSGSLAAPVRCAETNN